MVQICYKNCHEYQFMDDSTDIGGYLGNNLLCEFIINKRPVSQQTRNKKSLQEWKDFVCSQAFKIYQVIPFTGNVELRLTLVYLCFKGSERDVDNIIKPIQDALIGVIYEDDSLVTDVDSHRRLLSEPIDVTHLPRLLRQGVANGVECVYVRVSLANELESYL
jgi:Holliday junction resolvase RusA-like endonuclease